ncbi:2-hydroxyacid dehydrogenase [Pseudaestuariivita sp.]|uniref:2-hydroxyacid dehydrogenase n=1 Tax=Pseudaestuariivita sp. TaxID=2211669 RepID=UPI00405845F2
MSLDTPFVATNAKPTLAVTRRLPASVEAALAERFEVTTNTSDLPMDAHALRDALMRHDAMLPTVTDKLDAQVLDISTPQTRILANYGVGFSHIDLARTETFGMTVTNTPDVLSECTADLAIMLMLMVARRAGEGERELRAGRWTGWRPTHLVGTKVAGKTLGLVGFGRIGQEVARRAHFGFGMKIVVTSRSPVDPALLAQFNAEQSPLYETLAAADFVSLHCPGGAANRNLIGAAELNAMKPGAFLINTARGEVIDEAALTQALWYETIGGAALDVFDGEPRINPDLAASDRLVMLPHLGSATQEAREAMGFRAMDNLTAFFDGETPPDLVQ